MTPQDFAKIEAGLFALASKIVKAKRPEYTEGEPDVLFNFKETAKEAGIEPLQVWYIFFRKHLASVIYHLKNPGAATAEPIEGRFADLLNYLVLGLALFKEREQESLKWREFLDDSPKENTVFPGILYKDEFRPEPDEQDIPCPKDEL